MYAVQLYDGEGWVILKVFPCPVQAESESSRLYLAGHATRAVPLSWAVRDSIDRVAELYVD